MIVGKYLETTGIELETDTIGIWGSWESLGKVTSLKSESGKSNAASRDIAH